MPSPFCNSELEVCAVEKSGRSAVKRTGRRNRGVAQKRRGMRAEYKVRDLLREHGWKAYRVPLSGNAQGFRGDVVATKGSHKIVAEVKHMEKLPATLWRIARRFRPDSGASLLREEATGRYYAFMPAEVFVSNYPDCIRVAQFLASQGEHTEAIRKMPKTVLRMLEQAQREQAFLFLVVSRKPVYVLFPL